MAPLFFNSIRIGGELSASRSYSFTSMKGGPSTHLVGNRIGARARAGVHAMEETGMSITVVFEPAAHFSFRTVSQYYSSV
jgi:hypothetical protein